MYKNTLDDSGLQIEEESKSNESDIPKLVYNSEYFEQMPLLQWNMLKPKG